MAIPIQALPQALANALGRALEQAKEDEHLTHFYEDLAIRKEWGLSRR